MVPGMATLMPDVFCWWRNFFFLISVRTFPAILSTSLWPDGVILRPFSTFSINLQSSRDCRALRATLPALGQKCEGQTPLRLRPETDGHSIKVTICTMIPREFTWKILMFRIGKQSMKRGNCTYSVRNFKESFNLIYLFHLFFQLKTQLLETD